MPGIIADQNVNFMIAQFGFFAAHYTFTTPQREYLRIDELWENGLGYAETGLKAPEEIILTRADFLSAQEAKVAMTAYSNLMRSIVDIRSREGNEWIIYLNYKILRVRDISVNQRWSPTVSGGMVKGHYERTTEWIVQNVNGIW